LRGINVDGNNPIEMTELKACFEAQGFDHVSTYIRAATSFSPSADAHHARLTAAIEDVLSKAFNYKSRVAGRSYNEMRDMVRRAPKGFW
jgi:uncharacterized protein (DUF1697 family)